MIGESRDEILRGLTVAELRAAHWCVARELARRGEPVALVLPGVPEGGEPFGDSGRSPVALPGLRPEMARQGISVRGLARRSGVSQETVSDARCGTHRTQRAKAEAIADAIGVDIEVLRTPPPVFELLHRPVRGRERNDGRGAA